MAATTKTDFADFLKEWYRGAVVADLVNKNHPWLGLVRKTEARGNFVVRPVKYANVTGQSALYATANTNIGPAARERWTSYHIDNYVKCRIENKIIELSLGDDASFRAALTDEVDSAHSAFANDLHFELLARHAKGARAKAGDQSGYTLPEIKLGTGEARFFEVGMKVQRSDSGQASLDHSGEEENVAEVDRANDTITLTSDFTSATVATDYIYRSGDFNVKADSLASWLPGSGVSGTAFNGIVRSVDPTRLAGVDGVKGSGSYPYLSYLVQTGARLYLQGQAPNICLMNPIDVAGLAIETEGRGARYDKLTATSGTLSFTSLEVATGGGVVPVVSEPAVGSDTAFMGDRDAVELYSAGGVPRMFDKDGNFYSRTTDADSISFYLFGFYNQIVQSPVSWSFKSDIV
jgi:hypothetical protein